MRTGDGISGEEYETGWLVGKLAAVNMDDTMLANGSQLGRVISIDMYARRWHKCIALVHLQVVVSHWHGVTLPIHRKHSPALARVTPSRCRLPAGGWGTC